MQVEPMPPLVSSSTDEDQIEMCADPPEVEKLRGLSASSSAGHLDPEAGGKVGAVGSGRHGLRPAPQARLYEQMLLCGRQTEGSSCLNRWQSAETPVCLGTGSRNRNVRPHFTLNRKKDGGCLP